MKKVLFAALLCCIFLVGCESTSMYATKKDFDGKLVSISVSEDYQVVTSFVSVDAGDGHQRFKSSDLTERLKAAILPGIAHVARNSFYNRVYDQIMLGCVTATITEPTTKVTLYLRHKPACNDQQIIKLANALK